MTPNIYVKIGMVIFTLFAFFCGGYYVEHLRFVKYQIEVKDAAKEQEQKIAEMQRQHEIVKKGIENEYDSKLSLLRKYYADGVRYPSSGSMSNLSTTASIANATAAYNKLAQDCAMTTLQLTELQKWINESIGIK